ncbi:OPT family oligopeptide transporter [Polyangium spumosum]|uniref:OPT family oligopeptide transporter n=1 Tax=Polyangium spumosum TaxID=889282 RepID=A0A6N7Q016_9BACT|nr:OPT family oligopeptide transporter [Polyangium spumosum]MRG96070.1 OPT family oligopeptide transporter [Polyangium spumosum]
MSEGEIGTPAEEPRPAALAEGEGPLFQRAPRTAEEIEHGKPLEIAPEAVGEMDEDTWYAKAYRGDRAAQLTPRAVGMGAALGFLLAFTNLYVGLKTGWHLGVAITACILSFSIWGALQRAGIAKSPMTILENNCMQSTASSAGYSTGGTMVSAIPALLMLSVSPSNPKGTHMPWPVLAAWTVALALLGTVIAIPMKRNMINQERLRFPSGTAAAVTLQSLYSQGTSALEKGRALMASAAVAGMIPLLKDLNIIKSVDAAGVVTRAALLPGASAIFDWLPKITAGGKAYALSAFNIKLDHGVALVAAGALVGLRATISMVVGGLVLAIVVTPIAMEAQWTNQLGQVVTAAAKPQTAWKDIGLWIGAPMLVASGLLSFVMQWRTIVRAFQSFGKVAGDAGTSKAGVEVPMRWFAIGGSVATVGVVGIAWKFFGVPLHLGLLAVGLTFVLSLVACRATGETDITPTGAMGKIMQLIYGVLIPQSATANLMTAGITAGSASASADLLNDLKSGYLLGANPRRQFVAQMMGILPGTIATVVGFYMLIPTAEALTGDNPAFPAPAAQQWKAVAEVFILGIDNLHPMARTCIAVGLVVGAALVALEKLLPKYKKYLPSPTGIGLGFILPFYYPLAMFLGALLAYAGGKMNKKAEEMVVPIASGLIAGESIIGVIVATLNNFVLV